MRICQKCRTENPDSNGWCRRCGAPIGVTDAEIAGQARPIVAARRGLKLRFVALSLLATLGFGTLFALLAVGLGLLSYGRGLDSSSRWIFAAPVASVTVIALAAFAAGLSVARVSRGRTVREPVLGALGAVALAAGALGGLSDDAPFVAAAAAVPAAVGAGLGGFLGEIFTPDEEP